MDSEEISQEALAEINGRLGDMFETLLEAGLSIAQILTSFERLTTELLSTQVQVNQLPGNLKPTSPLREFEDGNYGFEFHVSAGQEEETPPA